MNLYKIQVFGPLRKWIDVKHTGDLKSLPQARAFLRIYKAVAVGLNVRYRLKKIGGKVLKKKMPISRLHESNLEYQHRRLLEEQPHERMLADYSYEDES